MRLPILVVLLAFIFTHTLLAAAQQYIGDAIPNSLPTVPGSEITYFRVKDTLNKNKNLTLINYYSHQLNDQRIVESQIQRAVIIIHGLNRDPGTYESNMMSALAQVTSDPNVNRSSVAIMAPYFPNGDDKNYGYPWTSGLSPGRGSTSNCLVWSGSQWSAGGNNQYPYTSTNTSSYTVLDQLIQYFDNTTLFPSMKQIVIAGHSLGGQTVQRYAAIGQPGNTNSPVTCWVANPNSYVWFETSRPLSTAGCPVYDVYREGYTNFTQYPMTYGVALVNSGRPNILATYNSKAIAYGRGTQDLGDDSSNCAPFTTGANRNERFFNFIAAFPPTCADPAGRDCDTVDFVDVGHDAGQMMASPAGQARLFLDNFYGNGSRAYDFGYPRQQAGDDPYPNPALNATLASVNNNTYAGNVTYWGCWSDQTPRTLANLSYTSNANTIELCTSTCAQGNNTIAGMEYGSQCFCGSALGYQATEVVDSSCAMTCPGNSNETCGGINRLSLFSNGRPAVQAAPGTPEVVDGFYYTDCYTEAISGRALSAQSTSGSFMTLEYCANFCSGFQYFGTEYSDECYCGNQLATGANITLDSECSMICANDTAEFCGAGNRLTIYQNPNWTPPSTTKITTTSPVISPTPTGVSCPISNNTIVISNGKNFTIECGIDHQGGDLTSTSVSGLQSCIDACAQNVNCVDVSLSGSMCYLKSSLGAAVPNANIAGAKLIVSTSTTSTGTSTTSATSGQTTSSPTATAVSCPGSNNTIYTTTNGNNFLIECGIDHAGGDMTNGQVGSFADCINLCATTPNCVGVSLSGSQCYLKSTLQPPVQNAGVWGAKLVGSTTSTLTSAQSPTSSTSSSTSSITTSTQSSTSSTTSSESPTSRTSTTSPSTTSPSTTSPSTTGPSTTSPSTTESTTSSSSLTTTPPTTASPTTTPPTTSPPTTNLSISTPPTTSLQTATTSITSSQTSTLKTSTLQTSTSQTSTSQTSTSQTSTSQTSTQTSTLSTSTSTSTSTTAASTALPSGFASLGCFVDSVTARVLPYANGTSTKQTPQQCALNCRALGFKYSGTEYSTECWCGKNAPPTAAPATDCKMKCSGDPTQVCGAGNRLSVVIDNTWKQTFFAAASYKTWNLEACYIDSVSSRLLPSRVSLAASGGGANATIGNCMDACAASGFMYCGAEYYAECWASKTAALGSVVAPGPDPLTAGCNYACNGNSSEACGGSNRILVYINNGTAV